MRIRPNLQGASFLNRRLTVTLAAAAAVALAAAAYLPAALASTRKTSTTASAPAVTAAASGTASLGAFRVVSYTPPGSRNGSTGLSYDLWGSYNAAQVQADLALIAGMGANAVRVFVSTGDTGASYPQVTQDFDSKLADFVSLAKNAGLKVVLSIFDKYPYVPAVLNGWTDTSSAKAWMTSVVGPYQSDPEIAYIEMRNEIPSPGYDSPCPAGSGVLAAAWLNTMMPRLRALAGTDPIVLSQNHGVAGYESLDAAVGPAAKPDAYSFHFYDVPGLLYGQLTALQQNVSRPVFVGETGYSTATSNTTGGGAGLAPNTVVRDAYQSWYLQSVASVTSALGIGMPGLWQLWDTPSASSTYESDFGLYDDSSGTPIPKPAVPVVASVFASAAAGVPVSAPSLNGTFSDPGTATSTEVPSPWNSYYIIGQTSGSSAAGGRSVCVTRAGMDSYFFEILPLAGVTGTHTLSAWSYGGNGYTSIAIRWLNLSGSPLGPDVRVFQQSLGSTWSQMTVNGLAPLGASTAEIILQSDTASNCFSNVSFS